MKKQFLVTLSFILFSCSVVLAQTHTKTMSSGNTKDMLSFGGNASGSTVSIMQVIDYPVLLISDENEKVVSYEFKIVPQETTNAKIIKVEGAKLNQEAIEYLRNIAGENGKISIQNVMTQKGDVTFETPYRIELNFNQ